MKNNDYLMIDKIHLQKMHLLMQMMYVFLHVKKHLPVCIYFNPRSN
jgi:hypothetical protein